jgi:hypothetical protein
MTVVHSGAAGAIGPARLFDTMREALAVIDETRAYVPRRRSNPIGLQQLNNLAASRCEKPTLMVATFPGMAESARRP